MIEPFPPIRKCALASCEICKYCENSGAGKTMVPTASASPTANEYSFTSDGSSEKPIMSAILCTPSLFPVNSITPQACGRSSQGSTYLAAPVKAAILTALTRLTTPASHLGVRSTDRIALSLSARVRSISSSLGMPRLSTSALARQVRQHPSCIFLHAFKSRGGDRACHYFLCLACARMDFLIFSV